MKVYVTRWCIPSGKILLVEAEAGPFGYFYLHGRGWVYKLSNGQYAYKADLFEDETSAVAYADWLRLKKLASLRKQIEKLERLQFTVETPESGI